MRWVVGFFVAMLAVAALVSPNPISATVSDRVAMWINPPGDEVSRLAVDAGLTSRGSTVLFANSPTLEKREQLAASCRNDSHGILGCYDAATRSIHLLAIDDPLLDGLDAGIAAHEMLHAVWQRMSESERVELTSLLRAEEIRLSASEDFAIRMSVYSDLDDAGYIDELHSVLALEARGLSPRLEAHYAVYFLDRAGLVDRTADLLFRAGY